MSGTVRSMERHVAELVGETDVEALTRRGGRRRRCSRRSTPRSRSRARSRRRRASCSTCCSSSDPNARVFALDTHVLFPETYDVWREVEQRYGIQVEVFEGPSLGRQAATHGDRLWERNPDLCCSIRKIGPLGARALPGLDGWITGVRRDQSPTRAGTPEARLGRPPRALEGEPARRLDGRRRLGVRPRARAPRQPAPRARLRVDRLHALHRPGHGPRGPLGRHRQDRVRAARLRPES